jgi:cation diffusion facilitator CzcD-associated flavoprotein CzcO
VQSHLYSFSFEPNPRWTRMFAPQGEILRYLEHCADKYGIRQHLRVNSEVKRGRYDEESGRWQVTLAGGETLTARFLVSGTGGLSKPAYPNIKGLLSFQGELFHTARWRHDFDAREKRVAVIGTGASAIQVVPEIVGKVRALKLFQRTPPWILPKPDRAISAREQGMYARFPRLMRAQRKRLYWSLEARAAAFVLAPDLMRIPEQSARDYLQERVKDPVLRAKLTPDYRIGCKRILLSNDYFEALQHPRAELVSDGIEEVVAEGIRTKDGRTHTLDAIVLATGFQSAEAAAPFPLTGRGGLELEQLWRADAEAYYGSTVTGFPNLFMIVGPNTGLGHSSMVYMIESHIRYIMQAIKLARAERLRSIEVRREVQEQFNRELQARMAKTIWVTGGCKSWYLTASGKNTTLWPGFTYEFRKRLMRFDSENYLLEAQEKRPHPERAAAQRPLPSPPGT